MAQKLHGKEYTKPSALDPESLEVTNAWKNKLKEAKGYSRGKKAVERVLGFADERAIR